MASQRDWSQFLVYFLAIKPFIQIKFVKFFIAASQMTWCDALPILWLYALIIIALYHHGILKKMQHTGMVDKVHVWNPHLCTWLNKIQYRACSVTELLVSNVIYKHFFVFMLQCGRIWLVIVTALTWYVILRLVY